MPVKVLIVDDSGFFRHRISDLLSGDSRIAVVGSAQNGMEAIEQAKKLKPDLITMDVEMPQMNGIDAVRVIMRECPTNILMLSSLTHEGAQVTLQALEAGALDYLSKDMRAWMSHSASLEKQLRDKVVALGRSHHAKRSSFLRDTPSSAGSSSRVFSTGSSAARTERKPAVPPPSRESKAPIERRKPPTASPAVTERATPQPAVKNETAVRPVASTRVRFPDCRIVVIGSSTGGPAALQNILTQLPGNFPYPILLIQHMPKTFTSVFASRLNQQCAITVKEAEDGDRIQPGVALLAPGGHQMMIDPRNTDRVKVLPGDERLTYKPSVDVTYASAAKSYKNRVLALILTGMGADGCDGANLLKQQGATVWAQNKDSSTIYGMPQAVVNAGLADEILDLTQIGPILAEGWKR